MNKLNQLPVSVIIPVFNNVKSLKRVLDELCNQTYKPKQIVIIDSSDVDDINEVLVNFDDDIEIVHKKVKKAYPGRARNIGAHYATEDCIAFLDSKTVPSKDWLENSFKMLKNYDVIFGSVSFRGVGVLEKLICASIYGENSLESISGTLISKNNFYKIGLFKETIRAGEDVDWRGRVKKSNLSFVAPSNHTSVYTEISRNLAFHFKRSFIYQLHGALVDIQHTTKIAFLSLFIIFLATLIPNWNNLVGYNNELLFIPHILKFFLLIMALFISYGVFSIYFLKISAKKRSAILFFVNLTIFIWLFIVIFYWNAGVANLDSNSPYYIPNITTLYLGILLAASIIIRGVIFPIKRGVSNDYLFPYRWVFIGLIGLILDISKAPGYFCGAIIVTLRAVKLFLRPSKKIKDNV